MAEPRNEERLLRRLPNKEWKMLDNDLYDEAKKSGLVEGKDIFVCSQEEAQKRLSMSSSIRIIQNAISKEEAKTGKPFDLSNKTLVYIAGKSGGGKTTTEKNIKKDVENAVCFVSTTTRSMRKGEKEGVNYYYTDMETLTRQALLEINDNVGGNAYAATANEFAKRLIEGDIMTLVIEADGLLQVQEFIDLNFPEIARKTVFMNPPDEEIRKNLEREKIPKKEIDKRLNREDFSETFKDKIFDKGIVSTKPGDFIEVTTLDKNVVSSIVSELGLNGPKIKSALDESVSEEVGQSVKPS